jgi:hypothetical protein
MACISERLSMNDLTPRGSVVKFDLDDLIICAKKTADLIK